MNKYFGPASAKQVDNMSDDECVKICRAKVSGIMGEDRAKEFDQII